MRRFISKFNFCSKKPIKKEAEYVYDKVSFEKINDKEFVKRMEKLENEEDFTTKKLNLLVPVILVSSALGVYFLWN